jgi:hypothetical protein
MTSGRNNIFVSVRACAVESRKISTSSKLCAGAASTFFRQYG